MAVFKLYFTAISFIIQVFDLSCGRLSQQCVCDDEHGGHGDSGRLLTNQPTNTEPADVTANRKKMVHGHANKMPSSTRAHATSISAAKSTTENISFDRVLH